MEDALMLCRALVRDGITTVVATPHQLGRFDGYNQPWDIRRRVETLQDGLDRMRIPLKVLAGGEVRVDERIPRLLSEDKIATLADGKRYLLLELPNEVLIEPSFLLSHLGESQVTIVIAHAERYPPLHETPDDAEDWIAAGAALQVSAGALGGALGQPAQRAAWTWLERGWVALVATDSHNAATRGPRMSEAIDAIAHRLGDALARCACIENPLRIVKGEPLHPAPAVGVRG